MAAADFSRLSILVVDDSPMMCNLLTAMLEAIGVKSVCAVRNGAEALNALKMSPQDILITDAEMGGLDGLDLVRVLRRGGSAPDPYIPIIMITGRCERQWVEAARDAGVNEFIAKPVSGEVLYRRLCEVILHPRPFVRTDDFVGPDRRRRVIIDYPGSLRRESDKGSSYESKDSLEFTEQE